MIPLLLLLSCVSEENPDTTESSFDADLREAIAQDIEETGATAFAMAVIKEGELVWSEGFGTHTKSGVPVTADTLFRVASLTKPMTAISVLQQVEDGCLDLASPVDAYIADFVMQQQPTMASELTVADTLKMTGGLVDYQLQTGDDGDGKIEEFLPFYLQDGFFLSPPGRMYNYSNTNFIVAGRLVELCSDSYFRSYMEEQVWGPLGMMNTTFSTSDVVANGDYAIGVTTKWPEQPDVEVSLDAESFAASQLWPAMGSWSSVNDLAKLGMFLMNGDSEVLSTALHEQMMIVQVDSEEGYPSKGYGYGLQVKTGIDMGDAHYPVTMVSHVGAVYGSSAHMYLVPELDIGVLAIINRDLAVPSNSVTIALGLDALSQRETVTTEIPTEFSDYVGSYYNAFNIGTFIITSDESSLRIEIPTLDQEGIGYDSQLEAVRPDNFIIHYPDDSFDNLSFLRDDSGAVEYIRHRNYVGERIEDSSLDSSPTSSANTPWDWASVEANLSVFE
ncbi:MAG: serine hydrolase [Rhodobacterales bacterium]|nr:serine hydrolase [Rhodobacterales bacterium]